MPRSISLFCLCFALMLHASLGDPMTSEEGVYTVTNGNNGALLTLKTAKGFAWFLSEKMSEDFYITLKCITSNTVVSAGWGPSDSSNYPDDYSYHGQIMPLLGDSGPEWSTDILALYHPSVPDASASWFEPSTFSLGQTYRFLTSSNGEPEGLKSYPGNQDYAGPGPKAESGNLPAKQGIAFEILGCGTATFCIQTAAEAASNPGVCDSSPPQCQAPTCENLVNQVKCYEDAAPLIYEGACYSSCPFEGMTPEYTYASILVCKCPDGVTCDKMKEPITITVSESKKFAGWKLGLAIGLPVAAVFLGSFAFIFFKLKAKAAARSSAKAAKYGFDQVTGSPTTPTPTQP